MCVYYVYVHIILSISDTLNDQFPWSLFRCNDIKRCVDLLDVYDWLIGLISTWDSQLQIIALQQVGGDILQLQCCQLYECVRRRGEGRGGGISV